MRFFKHTGLQPAWDMRAGGMPICIIQMSLARSRFTVLLFYYLPLLQLLT
jgi:hypothetical protein